MATASQKTLRVSGSHKKLRKRHGIDCPSELPEGTNSANIMILVLYSPELCKKKKSVVKFMKFVTMALRN